MKSQACFWELSASLLDGLAELVSQAGGGCGDRQRRRGLLDVRGKGLFNGVKSLHKRGCHLGQALSVGGGARLSANGFYKDAAKFLLQCADLLPDGGFGESQIQCRPRETS
jgi:hypothetical protein